MRHGKQTDKGLVDLATTQLAQILFMSWLELKGIDLWKYRLPSLNLESPAAEPPVSEDTDDLLAA